VKVIITIQAYNEEDSIGKTIDEIKSVVDYPILVLNDGSTDRTVEIAKLYGAKVISNKRNLGLAQTFKNEMKECVNYNIIVHTDADGQYPAKYIPQMINKVKEGYDLVLGSRFGKGNYGNSSLMKKLGNRAFAKVFSKLLKTKLTDTTTGFRAFTKEVAELPLINTFTYTQEQLIRVGKAKMKIAEVPINTNRTRPSKLFKNPFDYAIKAWINIFRIYRDFEPLKFFGKIGMSCIIFGVMIGLVIVYNVIRFDSAGGVPRIILSMMLILVGIQIILFGFLADMQKEAK